jgi:hypothetical protein
VHGPNGRYAHKEQDMTRRMTEIILVVAVASFVALPAMGQPTPGSRWQQRPQKPPPAQPPQTESLDNVKFAKYSLKNNIGVVEGTDSTGKSGVWLIRSHKDDSGKPVPGQDMIDIVKDLKPGTLMKITATITGTGNDICHWIDSVSAIKPDAPPPADPKAITFSKFTEALCGDQPKVTVLIKTGDKIDTLTVPNVEDNLGKWVPAPAIMAQIKEFKEGDKIEYTRQTAADGQVVIKTIKPAGAPDKAQFVRMTDKTIGGEKFTAIEVRQGADKPVTLLVPNTRDDKGKPVMDDGGNPVPDAMMLDAVKALVPDQMVEFKSKADNPNKVMLTEIKAVEAPTSGPADKAPDGDKPAAGAGASATGDKPADNASK